MHDAYAQQNKPTNVHAVKRTKRFRMKDHGTYARKTTAFDDGKRAYMRTTHEFMHQCAASPEKRLNPDHLGVAKFCSGIVCIQRGQTKLDAQISKYDLAK